MNTTQQHQSSTTKHTKTVEKTMGKASILKGYWFYFQDGDIDIAAFGSGFSGKETIYLNDNPVSEARSFGRRSSHSFQHNGKQYQVVFNVTSMMKGELECELYIDGKLHSKEIKAYITSVNPKTLALKVGMFFVIGFAFGFLGAKIAAWL